MTSRVIENSSKSKTKKTDKSSVIENREVSTNLSSLVNEDSGSGVICSTDICHSNEDDRHTLTNDTFSLGDLFDSGKEMDKTVGSVTDVRTNDNLRHCQLIDGRGDGRQVRGHNKDYASDEGLPHHRTIERSFSHGVPVHLYVCLCVYVFLCMCYFRVFTCLCSTSYCLAV